MSGDLISRSHLLSEIAELKKSPWYNDNTNYSKVVRIDAVSVIENVCIKQEPAVDVAGVKNGFWFEAADPCSSPFDQTSAYICSECGKKVIWSAYSSAKYCPNCGAKMIGMVEE